MSNCAAFLNIYCATVFEREDRRKNFFRFYRQSVLLVLDDMGDYQHSNGEVHLSKFEVAAGLRGCGFASIALETLVRGADLHNIVLTLAPTSFADNHGGLPQRKLESFYRRYGFRAVKGRVTTTAIEYRRIHEMIRKPR